MEPTSLQNRQKNQTSSEVASREARGGHFWPLRPRPDVLNAVVLNFWGRFLADLDFQGHPSGYQKSSLGPKKPKSPTSHKVAPRSPHQFGDFLSFGIDFVWFWEGFWLCFGHMFLNRFDSFFNKFCYQS